MQSVCVSVSRAVSRAPHSHRRHATLPWMATAVALAAPAWGQSPSGDESSLAEVIVTAQFREENLQDAPIAITAVSGEQLESQGLTNVTDLGLVIPNANIRPQGSFSGPTPLIGMRGVMTTDYIYTSDPGVGIYIDDVYHGSLTGSAIDLLDLERIEVLRGPQGTLFGKNSLGGAIRLISKQPQGNDTGTLELTYGTSNRLDLRGVYDFALTEKLFARVTGVSKQIEGYQDVLDFTCQMRANGTPELAGTFPSLVPSERQAKGDCKIGERGGSDVNAGRVMLRYLASDALDGLRRGLLEDGRRAPARCEAHPASGIRFTGDDRFVTGDPFKTYANPIDPVQGKTFPTDQVTTAWNATGKLDYRFSDTTALALILGYRTYESDWMGDGDQMPIDLNHTYELQSHKQYSVDTRLSGTAISNRLEWTAGAYWYDSHSHLGGYVTLPAFNSILPDFNQNDTFTTESTSGFLHGIFSVTDAFSITAGGVLHG